LPCNHSSTASEGACAEHFFKVKMGRAVGQDSVSVGRETSNSSNRQADVAAQRPQPALNRPRIRNALTKCKNVVTLA
jgi:hypothetical protein